MPQLPPVRCKGIADAEPHTITTACARVTRDYQNGGQLAIAAMATHEPERCKDASKQATASCHLAAWKHLALIFYNMINDNDDNDDDNGDDRSERVTAQDAEFAPHVTATCKTGTMNIRIQFTGPYNGVVHARDFRTPACMTFGNGTSTLALSLNLVAKSGNSEYCGTLVSNVSDAIVNQGPSGPEPRLSRSRSDLHLQKMLIALAGMQKHMASHRGDGRQLVNASPPAIPSASAVPFSVTSVKSMTMHEHPTEWSSTVIVEPWPPGTPNEPIRASARNNRSIYRLQPASDSDNVGNDKSIQVCGQWCRNSLRRNPSLSHTLRPGNIVAKKAMFELIDLISIILTLAPVLGPGINRIMHGGDGERSEARSVQLAVRVHKTLELADDKFYIITCGKAGFASEDSGAVALKFLDNNGNHVREAVYNREYTIKAEVKNSNGSYGIRVKNCFAFNKKNASVALIDDRGCPLKNDTMTRFRTSADGTSATAMITSMFRFSEGSEVNFQCDVVQCNGRCPELDDAICSSGDGAAVLKTARALGQVDDGMQLAATTVFVTDPAIAPAICADPGIRPHWLLWLTIALGVLFLIMLLMNIFLCTAMSCSCAQTEIIEKEPSIIEEYDPYRSWHGSQYGSRYSLHGGRDGGHNKGYTSGGSTIHSNRSLPIDSDHYAIVHSRPGSRHSGLHGHRPRGPPSNM
ncbi:hypothetical protein AND_006595 [Anopheles darlingi]|uniref:ZP domain-containing protein n=2 Tax=Nyssorhynchus TaxID=44543 RepID=W5JFZ5_ANODA|nr:hypothetical protein AND_006595 [Anopheles darlingi]